MSLILVAAVIAAFVLAFIGLRRPTEEECATPGYWRHGEDQLAQQRIRAVRVQLEQAGKRRVWLRERDGATRTILVIPGFAHRGAHFAAMARELWPEDQIILFDRSGIGAARPEKIGHMSDQERLAEALELVSKLIELGYVRGELHVYGHSEGATFLPHIAAAHPKIVTKFVPMDPVPVQRGAVLTNFEYFFRSLWAVPSVLRSLIHGSGVVVPRRAAKALFTNGSLTAEEFDHFYEGLVPDSAWAFVQLMLFYSGLPAYQRLMKIGWAGTIVMIVSEHSRIATIGKFRAMARDIGASALEVLKDEPHCFFAERITDSTAAVLHEALD